MTQLGVAVANRKLAAHSSADPQTCGATGSQRRDAACFGQAADHGKVWLQEVRGTLLDNVPEGEALRLALSGRNRHRHSAPNLSQPGQVVVSQPQTLERTLRKVRLVQAPDTNRDGLEALGSVAEVLVGGSLRGVPTRRWRRLAFARVPRHSAGARYGRP